MQKPKSKNSDSKRVLIIGAGVSGLTSAIGLLERGFRVTVVAKAFRTGLTTNVAGALWEWPPAVCGRHGATRSLARSKAWCMTSYRRFKELHAEHESSSTGIHLRDTYFYFRNRLENRPDDLRKMGELAPQVDGFERGLDIIPDGVDVGFEGGIFDAFKHMAPMVDTDVYLGWLMRQVERLGGEFVRAEVAGHVIREEGTLLSRYGAGAIVNCAGLGAISVAGDTSMYPLRGALVRVRNVGGVVDAAHCISHEDGSDSEQDIVFIVPRGNDTVILGGMAQPDRWRTSMSLEDKLVRQMYDGCLKFLPALRNLELDPEPVRAGLRPFTAENVCLESVPGTRTVHNYGHGGAGITLSWGCSNEVVSRVESLLARPGIRTSQVSRTLSSRPVSFILQDILPFRTDVGKLGRFGHDLVLLASRRGLSKVCPAEYHHFKTIRLVESYDLGGLEREARTVLASLSKTPSECRVATNDEYSVLLASQLREALKIEGTTAEDIRAFTDKSVTKQLLAATSIRVPKSSQFDRQAFAAGPDAYLDSIVELLGDRIFAKPTVGAGSEGTARIEGRAALADWCLEHATGTKTYELDEHIDGELFNTTIVRIGGKTVHFFACRHNRPNDEYLQGHPIGNIIVPEDEAEHAPLKTFSESVLAELGRQCPPDGVFNIDLFLERQNRMPVLMEVAARAPGGCVSKVVEACYGVRLDEVSLMLQMGETDLAVAPSPQERIYAAYSIHPPLRGRVARLLRPSLESEVRVNWHVHPGDRLDAPESMRDVAISCVIYNGDREALRRDFERLNQERYVVVDETPQDEPCAGSPKPGSAPVPATAGP